MVATLLASLWLQSDRNKTTSSNVLEVKDDGLKGKMCIWQSECPNGCVQVCFEHLHDM